MSLTNDQQKLVDEISKEFEDSKARYEEREKLGVGHTKYVVVSPNIFEIGGYNWAGESYDREEAKKIFFEVWGHSNGVPIVHPSVINYVYPSNLANEILDCLGEEDDSLHWSGRSQKGRHLR